MTKQQSVARRFQVPRGWLDSRVKVLVIGAGGNGGDVLDQLGRLNQVLLGLGHPGLAVSCMDGDTVSPYNIGRQRFSQRDVGANKAVTLINRINLFYGIDWQAWPVAWDAEIGFERAELIVSAVDKASVRHEIAATGAAHLCRLWLDFGNSEYEGQAILGELGEHDNNAGWRLPHVVDLFPEMRDDQNDGPSCSMAEAIRSQSFGVNSALVATGVAALLWPLFRKGGLDIHGVFMDLRRGSFRSLGIDEQQWAMLGHTPVAPSAGATGGAMRFGGPSP